MHVSPRPPVSYKNVKQVIKYYELCMVLSGRCHCEMHLLMRQIACKHAENSKITDAREDFGAERCQLALASMHGYHIQYCQWARNYLGKNIAITREGTVTSLSTPHLSWYELVHVGRSYGNDTYTTETTDNLLLTSLSMQHHSRSSTEFMLAAATAAFFCPCKWTICNTFAARATRQHVNEFSAGEKDNSLY